MPWRPIHSFLHITIGSINIQGNPLLSITGSGGSYISQSNSQNTQPYQNPPVPAARRVEAQLRIRRKLDEACKHTRSIYGIDNVAQVATDILSLIEGTSPSTFSHSLVDLAMDAHAMAYIALISCLYGFDENGRRKINNKSVRKLRRQLNSVYTLLVNEAPQKGVYTQIKRIFSKRRRENQVLCMQEELLNILRDIEKDEGATILTSLNLALDCPYQ